MRRVAVVAAIVVSVVPAACADAGSTPLETVNDAVADTLAARTARAGFTVTAVGPTAGPQPVRFRGEGTFDMENRIGSMRVTATDLPALKGDLTVIGHGPLQFVLVPPGVPTGKAWVLVDHRTLGGVPVDPLGFDQLLAADPSTALRWLRGAGGDVTRNGSEPVREVPTTRFALTIDMRRAAEQAPTDLRASMGRVMGRFERTRFPAEVWLDRDGLVRRLVIHLEPARPEIGAYVLSEELFDFGVRVAVPRPTIDESAPLGDVLGR